MLFSFSFGMERSSRYTVIYFPLLSNCFSCISILVHGGLVSGREVRLYFFLFSFRYPPRIPQIPLEVYPLTPILLSELYITVLWPHISLGRHS